MSWTFLHTYILSYLPSLLWFTLMSYFTSWISHMNEAHITHLQVKMSPTWAPSSLESVMLLAFICAAAFLSLLFTLPPMVVVAQTPSSHFMYIAQDINYDIAQGVIKMESDYRLWIHFPTTFGHISMWAGVQLEYICSLTSAGTNVRKLGNIKICFCPFLYIYYCFLKGFAVSYIVSCKNCPIKYIRSK